MTKIVNKTENRSGRHLLAAATMTSVVALSLSSLSKVSADSNQYDWTKQTGQNLINGEYGAVASSSNGSHLVIGTNGGGVDPNGNPLWVSTDYGKDWTDDSNIADPNINNYWTAVSVSDNGQKMVAASSSGIDMGNSDNSIYGKIVISNDGGSTWENITPNGAVNWQQVVISGDGSKIVALASDDHSDVYISNDGGATWQTSPITNVSSWQSLTISDNGNKVLIGGENSDVNSMAYLSDNGGNDWQNITPDTSNNLNFETKVAMTSDGNTIYVSDYSWDGTNYDAVYSSINDGSNWTDITPDNTNVHNWNVLSVSGSGNELVVQGTNSDTYISNNEGSNWTVEDPTDNNSDSNSWVSAAFNADGSRLITAGNTNAYLGYDSTLDSSTANITNPVNDAAVVITTPSGSTITCNTAVNQSNLNVQDSAYTYPLGLVDFCFSEAEQSNKIVLTFVTNLTPNQVVVRKYNPNTKTFATVPGAVVTETTVGGKPALQVIYTIVDNGPLDTNPIAGEIDDPVGLGTAVTAPNTGYGLVGNSTKYMPVFLVAIITLVSSVILRQILRKKI